MLTSNLHHSIGAPHYTDTLIPTKSESTLLGKSHFRSKEIRQQFVIRLYYFVNSSYLHGVRFLDRQYGAIDR